MNILILNGSPRINGNTSALVNSFVQGARKAGHQVKVVPIAALDISGCLGCEYCHMKDLGKCIQNDDMFEVLEAITKADMLVLASPIYYYTLTGQLQNAIQRTYAIGIPKNLKKSALILSSGSDNVYDPAITQYRNAIVKYMNLEDLGVYTAFGNQNRSEEKLRELYSFGSSL